MNLHIIMDLTIELIEEVSKLDTLQIKGLMTIGKLSSDPDEARQCFRLLKEIQQEVIEKEIPGVEMDILSMGMSDDFEIAFEEGSTMVRIGDRKSTRLNSSHVAISYAVF